MDAGALLLRLAILFVGARLAAELAERIKTPAVLVEIAVGIVIGPSLLGIVDHQESLRFLGELGAIFLLLEVGLHMDLADLRRVGRSATQVAVIGVVVPMVAGFAGMRAIGIDPTVALFLAAGITATSVGITARVFAEMRTLASAEAQTVLGAAVADDVIGLLILTVVTRLSTNGSVDVASIAVITVVGLAFVFGGTAVGAWLAPRVFNRLVGRARTEGTLIGAAVAFTIAFAGLASAARLAPIVGAFVAGIALGRIPDADDLRRRLAPVGHLFIPVFFLLIGVDTDVRKFIQPRALYVAAILGVIAVAGKVVSGWAVKRGSADRLLVGIGMIPRGEVGVVFASIGLASGVLGARDHASLVAVILATTVVAPPWLRRRIERTRRVALERAANVAPVGGWLDGGPGEVELRAEPPIGLARQIGLEAALACVERRPGPRLLDWLSRAPADPPQWDGSLRQRFLALLRGGNTRSWRLLEVTGVLPSLLPDLDGVMRRRLDPFDLDPAGALRWDDLEALNALVRKPDDPAALVWRHIDQDAALLAAFVRSVYGDEAEREADRFAAALGLPAEHASMMRFLTAEHDLFPAAAARLSMGSEDSILELGAHMVDRSRCDALYVLAAARVTDPTHRERLDELYALVTSALEHPELVGTDAADLVEARKNEVLRTLPRAAGPDAARLLEQAPRRYVLSHSPEAIARHLNMLEPPPTRSDVRMHPEPDIEHGEWTLHVVTVDRPGALAAIASAFAAYDIPIVEASVSTWKNGLAVDVFRVSAPSSTQWEDVQAAAAAALERPGRNGKPVAIDGSIEIDNAASPWHTIVEIRAHDRAGLLQRVSEVFSRVGIQIQHATVRTVDGQAVDTFLVTDKDGHKLDEKAEANLVASFAGKTRSGWAPWSRRRRASAAP